MTAKKTTNKSAAIRLPMQTNAPSPKDVVRMSKEAKKGKKRVELPWHPEGRPEAVVLTVGFDPTSGKANWLLFDGIKTDSGVVWSAVDPDSTKVSLAMRDWLTMAQMTEGWNKPAPKPRSPLAKATASVLPDHSNRGPAPDLSFTPAYTFPALSPQEAEEIVSAINGEDSLVKEKPASAAVATAKSSEAAKPSATRKPAAEPKPEVEAKPAAEPKPAEAAKAAVETQAALAPEMPQHWAHSSSQQSSECNLQSATSMLLGDLLVTAGILPSRTLQAALTLQNTGYMERKKLGEILLNAGAIPSNVLQAAVKLQDLARTGAISDGKVTEYLKRLQTSGGDLESLFAEKQAPAAKTDNKEKSKTEAPKETIAAAAPSAPAPSAPAAAPTAPAAAAPTAPAKTPVPANKETKPAIHPGDELIEKESQVSEEDSKKLKHVMALLKQVDFSGDSGKERAQQLLDLFKQAAVVKEEAIRDASKNGPADAVKALLVKEAIDPVTFRAGLDCQKLLLSDRLRPEQAIIALGYCQRSRVGLKDAICDMNWLIPTDDLPDDLP